MRGGGDFENRRDRDPDVGGIDEVRGDRHKIKALVAFMKALTDERVRKQSAPFDHPELWIPNGHAEISGKVAVDDLIVIPETGAKGGEPFLSYEEILRRGGQPVLR